MRDNKISNSSTTTVTDESLPLRDAQVNVATPNPLEGEELITKSLFGGRTAPVTEHLRARTTDAKQETKAEKELSAFGEGRSHHGVGSSRCPSKPTFECVHLTGAT